MNKDVLKSFFKEAVSLIKSGEKSISLKDLILADKEIVSKTIKHITSSSYYMMHVGQITSIQEGFNEWIVNREESQVFPKIKFPTTIDYDQSLNLNNPIMDLTKASEDEIALVYHMAVLFLIEYYLESEEESSWQRERVQSEVTRTLNSSIYFFINLGADHATYIGNFSTEESHFLVFVIMLKFYRNLDKDYVRGILEYLTYLFLEFKGEYSQEVLDDFEEYLSRTFPNLDLERVFQLDAIMCIINIFDIVEYFLELFIDKEGNDIFPRDGYTPSDLQATITNWALV